MNINIVNNLLEEYDIILEDIEDDDYSKEYIQTEVENRNTTKLAKKVLYYSKHRPSALNRSDLIENAPKLHPEKKEVIAKSAVVGHSRRISSAADAYSFGNEIKAFRKLSAKIDEKSEKEEMDHNPISKKIIPRKSAFEPIIKNGLKKINYPKKYTNNNVNAKKKEDSKLS
jgi:hypothetical protein